MLDRYIQPLICEPEQVEVLTPQSRVMPNGVPLYIFNAEEHEVVRIDILMKGGRWHQTQHLQALFTNRLLREGTRRYSAATIAEKLDYYGAWLELSSSLEYACITLYSLIKYLPEMLDLLESMIKEPVFPAKELQIIVDNNIQQFKVNLSKVDFLAHRTLMKALFGEKHPCGQVLEEKDYRLIESGLLSAFYHEHYNSDNCRIYLSGKVTDDCLAKIEEIFGKEPFGLQNRIVPEKQYIPVSSPEKRFFCERADAFQSSIKLGTVTIDNKHPDYLKLRVLTTLFGGYFGSRLMSNIREEKGYTYSISAGLHSYPGSSLLAINSETTNELVEPLIQEIYHEMSRLQEELVSEKELSMVKNYMLGEICRSYESAFSLSDAWIFIHTSGFPDSYISDVWKAVHSVTSCEMRELAGTYLCKENLKEVISGKKMV